MKRAALLLGLLLACLPVTLAQAEPAPTIRWVEFGHSVNPMNAMTRDGLLAFLHAHLEGRPDLVEKVMPDYPAMGKRILQDDGSWFACLKKPNVDLVRTGIERIEARAEVVEQRGGAAVARVDVQPHVVLAADREDPIERVERAVASRTVSRR